MVAADSVAEGLQAVGRFGIVGDFMKDPVERFLSKADQEKIEACVRKVESRTQGEIVVMVVPASHHYPLAGLLGASAFAFPAAVALTPMLGGLFWVGPFNLWVFLAALIPLFLGFHEAFKHIRILKRSFIHGKEMDEEVHEAAHVQFFHKGLYRTREENGVLIYISVFERRVCLIGDRGINAVIPEAHWNGVVGMIVQAIKDRRQAEGICQAVDEIGRILQEKFPIKQGDQDELQNLIVEHRQ